MKTNLFILPFTLLFQYLIFAQNLGETTWGSWYEITSSNRITNALSLSGSYTNWNYELPRKNTHLHLGIVGINYHFNKNISAGVGYAYGDIDTSFEINNTPDILEHRILEQVVLKHKLFKLNWSHRFKLEQRFLEYPTEDILKHRLRYRLKGKQPLNKTLFLSFYDEIHFNLNEFDFQQNRAYLGLGINIDNHTNIDLGYARHSFKTKSFHRLSVQLNLKYDFRNKKS
ncbi:DUF2490 domain-containing protein [Winogradskyella sp. SYSU M77433]|uniref:DUF2490 domain-containing protein n=1 Tax=Winogradskyella sp. SYSU M77433 TaxID=3042722 RepID=UPI0024814DF7|nr:DUF2490 domain-containing protein [Winogradskyella sp. SYSU M77433]MDH7914319.1 DUF2490 domain-containing protein [Winogradskyella sp. SYSU M77433]